MKISYLELQFFKFAKANQIVLTKEHQFHPSRKWRFDFVDIKNKVAIEIEGGIWSAGRHTRGSGFKADCEKYNAAVCFGWKVLRYTSMKDVKDRFLKDYDAVTAYSN